MYNETIKDRIEAGFLLSEKLKKYRDGNSIILAIPRGGVPIGYEIAKSLHLPLDIILSKKIGHPYNKEFAIGAVSLDSLIVDEHPDIPKEYIEKEVVKLRKSLREKYELYMGNREPLEVVGKNVILVDDGIATGNTLMACIGMLRKRKAGKIIVAVPVLPHSAINEFELKADELIYLMAPKHFRGVGEFYDHFDQVEDEEVIRKLSVAKISD